jgi:hypothetical protein
VKVINHHGNEVLKAYGCAGTPSYRRNVDSVDNEPKLTLSGIDRPVEEMFARERAPIPDGEYTIRELAERLRDGWIPYLECHKCGWFDSCPFPQRKPLYPDLAEDIQCGVANRILTNCLAAWWPRLQHMNHAGIQEFVDALFHFVQFVLSSHQSLGTLFDAWDPEWWGPDMAPQLMVSPLFLREDLNELAGSLQHVPSVRLWKSLIAFVEGESERAFLQKLRDRRQLSDLTRIEVLGGKGNATLERIPLGLLHRQGYRVSLQLDADGSKTKKYRELAERVRALGGTVFVFRRDFESAFPAPVLAAGLEALGADVDLEWLTRMLSTGGSPILRGVEQKYGCRVSKINLGAVLGEIVEDNWTSIVRDWPESELVQWVGLLTVGRPASDVSNGD